MKFQRMRTWSKLNRDLNTTAAKYTNTFIDSIPNKLMTYDFDLEETVILNGVCPLSPYICYAVKYS